MLASLYDYARDGNLEALRELLGPTLDINLADTRFGKTALCWAAEYGRIEAVELLLSHGADFDVADLLGRKPMLWAARNGRKNIIQLLLDRGDGVDSRDKGGLSPLALAVREGHSDVARLLIRAGDEVNSKDINGQTPLSFAAMNGNFDAVQLLLGMGADPDVIDSSKYRSPLSFAAEKGYLQIVKCLLAKDCQINSRDRNGRIPLSWAAENGNDEVIQVLLAASADVNSKDNYNRTPLSYASELGHFAVVGKFLQVGDIEYDFQDTYYDQTPLSWAAEKGHEDIVKLLLERGADADTRDRAGHTPLLWAIRNGHSIVVELLLDQDVEVIVRDEENWTPLSLAAYYGDKPLTQRLLQKAVEINSKVKIAIAEAIEDALWRAIESLSDASKDLERAKEDPTLNLTLPVAKNPFFKHSDKEVEQAEKKLSHAKKKLEAKHATVLEYEAVVNLIVENDEYLNIRDYKERTLLSWAAENGRDEVLELLLNRGLSPNSIDQLDRTPISWAAKEGHESTVRILLDKNVHPDWRDGAGRTPLSLAAEKGNEAVVKLLLNIDVDTAAQVYDLPLDMKKKPAVALYSVPQGSSDNFHPEVIKNSIVEPGVDYDSRDNSGKTPLLFAAKEGHGKVVGLLLDKGANLDVRGADNKSLWQLIEEELQSPATDNSKATNLQEVQTLLESRLADGQLLTVPLGTTASVDAKFNATVVHFIILPDRKRDMLCRKCSVLDLLNGKMTDEVVAGKQIACKWLHVPANNMRWIEIIMARHYKGLQKLRKHNIVLKKELWTGLQHRAPEGIHHARFMRPTCQALPLHSSVSTDDLDQDSEEALKGLVLFMPYLHWETEENLNEMKDIIRQHEMVKSGKMEDCQNKTRKESGDYRKLQELVQAYLDDKHPLHIRRTLDQFYYHTLKDTEDRDRDQTGTRYHKNFELKNKKIVTMVDQLWLWVLPGFGNSPATVITSFPQRSNRVDSNGKRNDEKFTSLFSNIIAQTQDRPVENGHDLAEIISSECSRIYFDTMTDRDRTLQFLEIYATSIGEITDKETKCFNKFQKTLESDREVKKKTKHTANLSKAAEDTLSITEEIRLLQEVKDIRDELNIMLSVFNAQRKALKDMARIMGKSGTAERRISMSMSSQTLPRITSWGSDSGSMHRDHHSYPLPLSTVESNISEVKDMDKYAERAYMALNHLLDLKQKQANVLEAKATHELTTQAIIQGQQTVDLTMATSSQGKMITFFTIITIVFMPLSFMAAFFAINIAEFPRDADGLSLGYVSKYMFSISVAIIVPSIIIAFNLQNMEDYLKKRRRARSNVPAPYAAAPNRAGSVGSGRGAGEIHVEVLEVDTRRKQRLCDEEQGKKSSSGSF